MLKVKTAAELLLSSYKSELDSITIERLDINGVQASIISNQSIGNILLIHGTNEISDWLRYNLQICATVEVGDNYCWHKGFLRHAQIVYAFVKNKDIKLIIGHSLGAAAAGIVAVSLNIPAITFAAPRALYGNYPINAYLVQNYNRTDDLITKLPFKFLGFKHCGIVHNLKPNKRHIGFDHFMKNYLEIIKEKEI